MSILKLRNSGIAIAATLLFSLFAVSAQSATISDTDGDATLTLTVDDSITDGLDQDWGTLNIVVNENSTDLTAGDTIEFTVYDDDGFFSDTELWSFDYQVTGAEASAGSVDQTFDVSWLAGGTSFDVYAYAKVVKDDTSWWQSYDRPQTGSVNVTVAPPAVVPIPAAAWLFGSAMLGLFGVARRKKA